MRPIIPSMAVTSLPACGRRQDCRQGGDMGHELDRPGNRNDYSTISCTAPPGRVLMHNHHASLLVVDGSDCDVSLSSSRRPG